MVRIEGYFAVGIGHVGGISLLTVFIDPPDFEFLSVLESDVTGDGQGELAEIVLFDVTAFQVNREDLGVTGCFFHFTFKIGSTGHGK